VGQDPINGVDPNGTETLRVEGGVGAAGSELSTKWEIDFDNWELDIEVTLRIGVGPEVTGGATAQIVESDAAKGNRAEASAEGNARASASASLGPAAGSATAERSFGGRRISTDRGREKIEAHDTETEVTVGLIPGIGAETDLGGSVGVDLKVEGTISAPEIWRRIKGIFE